MNPSITRTSGFRPIFILVSGLFFLSGSAGLVYQVLWMRHLGLFFGSDMYGVAITLGTFMGGLALGSLLGGRVAEHTTRPLMWYGMAELGIGGLALLVPLVLGLFEPILRSVYPASFQETSNVYQAVRVLLAGGTLLVPTMLMGATLPLIMRQFVHSRSVLGESGAFFYGINTLGALVGTLVAGFILLPYLGMFLSTAYTATLNVVIGVTCLMLGYRYPVPRTRKVESVSRRVELDTLPDLDPETRKRVARAALVGMLVSGIGSFALEVVWTRILIMSFSATVYSFTSMLASFLFGIFFGSLMVSRLVDRIKSPLALLAALELGIGAAVALLSLLVNAVPGFFNGLLSVAMQQVPNEQGGGLVFATLAASFFLLVVPTTLLGATFSVALRAYTINVERTGSRTGNLYFANTVGAIIGSLGALLILLPTIGTKASLGAIALLFTANGLYLAFRQKGSGYQVFKDLRLVGAAAATMAVAGVALSIPGQVTLNFNQDPGADTRLIYHREGIQSTIDILESGSGITSLVIGGNIEADNGYTQRRHFILKGHLPLMFLDRPESVLVVGLGMGITLQATARHEGVKRLRVVELSPEIKEAHQYLREVNGDILGNPLVDVRIDDGRSYMKLGTARYDMITADPIHPKISRVGYLYTSEYYESIRERLREGGVVCQWMPIYQMSPKRLRSAMKTFLEVFPNATFWYVKNHGLLVAKLDTALIDYRQLVRNFNLPAVREDLASIDIDSPEEFLDLLLMGPKEIRAFTDAESGVPLNSDDYPYLEYFVPGDLFYQPIQNVRELLKYAIDPTGLVDHQPPASRAVLRALVAGRADRLIAELESIPRSGL